MIELIYINELLTFNGIEYTVANLEATSDINVLAIIENDIYVSVIALVAEETLINGVLQTSAQMIIETLTTP
jgi:hypothetical protein